MAKIKVSELFYSIQGEGRYQGVPSVFLRTFGCNFKCAGFGLPKGQLTKEVDGVAEQVAEQAAQAARAARARAAPQSPPNFDFFYIIILIIIILLLYKFNFLNYLQSYFSI